MQTFHNPFIDSSITRQSNIFISLLSYWDILHNFKILLSCINYKPTKLINNILVHKLNQTFLLNHHVSTSRLKLDKQALHFKLTTENPQLICTSHEIANFSFQEANLPKSASSDRKLAMGLSPTITEKADTLSVAVPDL